MLKTRQKIQSLFVLSPACIVCVLQQPRLHTSPYTFALVPFGGLRPLGMPHAWSRGMCWAVLEQLVLWFLYCSFCANRWCPSDFSLLRPDRVHLLRMLILLCFTSPVLTQQFSPFPVSCRTAMYMSSASR